MLAGQLSRKIKSLTPFEDWMFSHVLQVQLMVVATLALAVAVAAVLAVAVVPALLVAETLDKLAQEAFRVFLFRFPLITPLVYKGFSLN
ncbi:hypothetical protein IID10_16465 [candidate division KSB1 bacterium]|nr:hypothetical protein [candidate division KSB1 bacterium]